MILDESLGLGPALYIGAGIGILAVLATVVLAVRDEEPASLLLGGTIIAAGVAAAVFCATFGILNVALQLGQVSVDSVRTDLGSGTLTLRIVSLLLLVKITVALLRLSREDTVAPLGAAELRGMDGRPPESWAVTAAPVHDPQDVSIVEAAQYIFYLSVLTLLWVLNAQGVESAAAVLLSFALLFVVDDWIIVSDYVVLLNGHLLNRHRIRINVANAVLAPMSVGISFYYLPIGYAVIATLVIGGSLAARYGALPQEPATS